MKLNWIERYWEHSFMRKAMVRAEASWLFDQTGPLPGARVLEIACGSGETTRLILDRFRVKHLTAIDLDERQLRYTERRLSHRYGERLRLQQADAVKLPFEDQTFDAVFALGCLHHIAEWKDCVREAGRVLKTGGRYFFEEPLRPTIVNPITRLLTEHPWDEQFLAPEYLQACAEAGLSIERRKELGRWLMFGTGTKLPAPSYSATASTGSSRPARTAG